MIQVQNVTFFREKNLILIARGMKKTWLSHTQKGVLVVKMKGFDKYWFDPNTMQVYSKKSNFTFYALKVNRDELKFYFNLSINGHSRKVYYWEILLKNKEGIETFCLDSSLGANGLDLVG